MTHGRVMGLKGVLDLRHERELGSGRWTFKVFKGRGDRCSLLLKTILVTKPALENAAECGRMLEMQALDHLTLLYCSSVKSGVLFIYTNQSSREPIVPTYIKVPYRGTYSIFPITISYMTLDI